MKSQGKTLMIQGTGSHVGKSVLVTALCRWFCRRGLRVAPFKAQNMALNSFVTAEGHEIGWAQAVQAEAARLLPRVDFNPVLLKPTGDKRSQVIVMGNPIGHYSARQYEARKKALWPIARAALNRLRASHDLVLIEGAGSPAEINLKKTDIVNMRVAKSAESPVLLVGDIDRGGVFASLLGTLQLLTGQERRLVRGLIINKFRGDKTILDPGVRAVEKRTGKRVLGVLPTFDFVVQDQEDSVALDGDVQRPSQDRALIRIAVLRTPRISNFTDFDPLRREPSVSLSFVERPEQWDSPDLIILPGSKSTLEDLQYLKRTGLAARIQAAAKNGATVLGICAGYQMLGMRLQDAHGVESALRDMPGLGLLDTNTAFAAQKSLHQVDFSLASHAKGFRCPEKLKGYEIHMGQTSLGRRAKPFFLIHGRSGRPQVAQDGAVNALGNVIGTYMHGLFLNDAFRHALIKAVASRKGKRIDPSALLHNAQGLREQTWDQLADWADRHLDMRAICRIAGIK